MESVYYLVMLLGVAWLCIWSIVPEPYRRQLWWPFDMRDDAEDGGHDGASIDTPKGPRRRDAGGTPADIPAAPAADLQHALPQSRPAQSWRLRREQAQASRRQRRG